MSTLSILVPCYKQSQYTDQCIQSILACNPAPAQIIASANHCPDGSEKVLEKYANDVQIIAPPHHLPANEHFSFLASHSSSTFTSIVCADDYVAPSYVGVLSDLADRWPDAAVVRSAYTMIDGANRVIRRASLRTTHYLPGKFPPISFSMSKQFPFNFIESCGGSVLPMLSWAFRTDKLRNQNFFSSVKLLTDWQAFLDLSLEGAFITSHKRIAYYRANYRPLPDILMSRARVELLDAMSIGEKSILPCSANLENHLRRIALTRYKKKLANVAQQFEKYLSITHNSIDIDALLQYRKLCEKLSNL